MNENESFTLLSRSLDQAEAVIVAVREDQLDRPTPCGGWDVGALTAHLASGPALLLEMARGGSPDWDGVPDRVDDPAQRLRSGADELLDHWRSAAETELAGMGWQIAEFAIHTWDLATATGQTPDLDPAVAERGLAFMSAVLKPEMRGHVFAPEQQPPADATAHERLAAYAGREVR